MGAAAVGPDQGDGGSQVSKRLIPEEPMVRRDVFVSLSTAVLNGFKRIQSIILNLGISSECVLAFHHKLIILIICTVIQTIGNRSIPLLWNSPALCL